MCSLHQGFENGSSNSDGPILMNVFVKPEPAQASKSRLNSLAPVRGEVLTNALMHLVLLCLCLKVSLCQRKSLMNFKYLHCPFVGGLCMRNKITKANFGQTDNGKINWFKIAPAFYMDHLFSPPVHPAYWPNRKSWLGPSTQRKTIDGPTMKKSTPVPI